MTEGSRITRASCRAAIKTARKMLRAHIVKSNEFTRDAKPWIKVGWPWWRYDYHGPNGRYCGFPTTFRCAHSELAKHVLETAAGVLEPGVVHDFDITEKGRLDERLLAYMRKEVG